MHMRMHKSLFSIRLRESAVISMSCIKMRMLALLVILFYIVRNNFSGETLVKYMQFAYLAHSSCKRAEDFVYHFVLHFYGKHGFSIPFPFKVLMLRFAQQYLNSLLANTRSTLRRVF